jgi:hypothetical protein
MRMYLYPAALLTISNSPQNRHPERSASQIYRLTQRSMARSRRTPRVLISPMPLGAFRPPKPENRILLGYALDGHGHICSCTVIIFHPQVCAKALNSGLIVRMRLSLFSRRQPLSCCPLRWLCECLRKSGSSCSRPQGKTVAGPPRCGLRWLKSSEQHGQDKHPRGPSTPRHQALCHAIDL